MQKTKKELVKQVLRTELNTENEEELIDLLVNSPIAVDVDKIDRANAKKSDIIADKFALLAGSWGFIIGFSAFLLLWVLTNTIFLVKGFDPYPFILLNLFLSCVAALQAPIIMMSQNRQAKKESMRNDLDYRIDLKSELILEELYEKINTVLKNQTKIINLLDNNNKEK